jgi:beta-glucosidase
MRQPAEHSPQIPQHLERVEKLLGSLGVEERAQLTAGIDGWHPGGADSIGLGPMLAVDGPNGVRNAVFPEGSSATCTPCGTGLGATWDVDLVAEVAARIGSEAKRAGVHYLLGPVLNLVRSPVGGRDFESFSEDPCLASQLAVAYVEGMQSQGVAACPKHLVANESESHRRTVSSIVDERAMREVYLLPFEAAARAGAWSMMAAYNRVNGVHCSENPALIGSILREDWGWDGVLMSDWHATHDTVAAARAGLDLEMPGPPLHFGPALAAAVRRGDVGEATLESTARRILTLAARVGALPLDRAGADTETGTATGTAVSAEAAPAPSADEPRLVILSDAIAAALVRRAAADSFVLLANDGTLPLRSADLERVAVVGPNAARPCTQGGGAANIAAPYQVTPLAGLRSALPDRVEVVHEPGCGIDLFLPPLAALDVADLDGKPGLTVEYYRGQEPGGEPVARRTIRASEVELFHDLPGGLRRDDFSVRMSTWLTPTTNGPHRVAMRGAGGRRFFIDGKLVADAWHEPGVVDLPAARFEGKEVGSTFEFEAGKRVLITAEARSANAELASLVTIGCAEPDPDTGDPMTAAVVAAAAADVAIVVVGNDDVREGEGRDRRSTALPGRQDELVERVAAANRRTVVVVNAGCPTDLPWADKVAAIVYAWLPGQEFGNALADVLLGVSEPGGRLPLTLARSDADYPAYDTTPNADEELVYAEGVNVGYRGFDVAGVEPRFAFGHGLGYTTFEYESLDLGADGLAEGEPLELRVKLRNTGSRPGKEVVQVYVADLEASVPRPPRELKGFAVVRLEPGATAELTLALEDRDLGYWDEARHSWRIEPGRFEIQVGRSARDIRLRRVFELA